MKTEIIFDSPRLKVFKSEKGFVFSERNGKDSIAVLPYRKNDDKIEVLIRLQPLVFNQGTVLKFKENDYRDVPADELIRCPITGSLDSTHDNIIDYVIEEMKEEAGYFIKPSEVKFLGYYFVGTQTNEVVHCFTCDVSNKPQQSPEGDGTYWESISKNEWIDFDDLVKQINDIHYSGLIFSIFKLKLLALERKI
jgi:8-oxo-dGTP diphosphatase